MKTFKQYLKEDTLRDTHYRRLGEKAFHMLSIHIARIPPETIKHIIKTKQEFRISLSEILPQLKLRNDVEIAITSNKAMFGVMKAAYMRTGPFGIGGPKIILFGAFNKRTYQFIIKRDVFIHEFIHAIDFNKREPEEVNQAIQKQQFKNTGIDQEKTRDDIENEPRVLSKVKIIGRHVYRSMRGGAQIMRNYANSDWEYNSFYQQGLAKIEDEIIKIEHKPSELKRRFPVDFHRFFNNVKKHFATFNKLDDDNKKRLLKRLYSYHQEEIIGNIHNARQRMMDY